MNQIRFLLIFFSPLIFSQTQEATLHFKDGGESIKGYGEIFQFNKIKFSLEPEGEISIWTGDIVEGITFHEFERDIHIEYTFTKRFKRTPVLLEVIVFGEVKLYNQPTLNSFITAYPSGDSFTYYSDRQYKTNFYYVKRDSEPYAIRLKGNFKKRIKEYFGDCTGIQKRIKSHEFRWKTLPELVIYYNTVCADL